MVRRTENEANENRLVNNATANTSTSDQSARKEVNFATRKNILLDREGSQHCTKHDKLTTIAGTATHVTPTIVVERMSSTVRALRFRNELRLAMDSPITIFDWNRNFTARIGKPIAQASPTINMETDEKSKKASRRDMEVGAGEAAEAVLGVVWTGSPRSEGIVSQICDARIDIKE
jgi:hypothetical protein